MAMISVKCPFCGSDKVVKNGTTAKGKQTYLCKNNECSHTSFQDEYTYKACDPKVKEKIFDLTVNGNGTRATGRALGISKDTVTAALKKKTRQSTK
jgi:transposase-like protein